MFNNQIFDSWLNKKSDEILSKVDRETISTEEMIILVLKAQTNHFYHVDIDMKKGMAELDGKISALDIKFEKKFDEVEKKINDLDLKFEKKFDELDSKFEKKFDEMEARFGKKFEHSDSRFLSLEDRMTALDHKIDNRFMWMIGITIAMSGGIYLKLFLG